jgi:RsiW-degrading membrane proteinase PrsW (M82 family)
LACCGLLLSDRNYYLALAEVPTPWWKRFGIYVGMPFVVLTGLAILSSLLATPETKSNWDAGIAVTSMIMVVLLLTRAKYERVRVRRAVMTKLHAKKYGTTGTPRSNTQNDDDDDEDVTDVIGITHSAHVSVDSYLQLHQHDVRAAHALCSCFANDVVYITNMTDHDVSPDGSTRIMHQRPPADLCRCLWNTLLASCCGVLCGSWWQCCGMCAIAQEDRELRHLLDKKDLQVDYITFEPYTSYMGRLQDLRQNQVKSLWLHGKAISQLSRKLLTILMLSLLWLTSVALLNLDPQFHAMNLAVVIATFSQAFLIIYFVHWNRNRFDLSLDAVIKYFSSGFVFCTFMAMVYEMLASSVLGAITYIIVLGGISGEVTPNMTGDDLHALAKQFAKDHVGIFGVFVFLNAFVVAALIEELSKYFGFWMVEHPDLMDAKDLAAVVVDSSTDEPAPVATNNRTLQTRAAATTIAMVAVAAGFACSENLLYVFVYSPPTVTNEISTLVARSLFPVHPLCAAIQSLGVVRRDLEGDTKSQLGRILFPAILLHGAFDFVLMFLALLDASKKPVQTLPSGGSDDANDAFRPPDTDSGVGDVLPLLVSVGLVVIGFSYYGYSSALQRKRLLELEQGNEGGESDTAML